MGTQFDPIWPGVVGVDVSHHQQKINWKKLAKAGVSFAYIKATEGVGYIDPRFFENVKGAKEAGIIIGAYHFGMPKSRVGITYTSDGTMRSDIQADARAEVMWFHEVMQRAGLVDDFGFPVPGTLPPALDIEWGGAEDVRKVEVTEWCTAFCDYFVVNTGLLPVVYVGPNFARWKLDEVGLRGCPLWLVRYNKGKMPSKTIPGWPWTFWQHSGSWKRPDRLLRRNKIDANRFAGSMSELRAMAGLPPQEGEKLPEVSWIRKSLALLLRMLPPVRRD